MEIATTKNMRKFESRHSKALLRCGSKMLAIRTRMRMIDYEIILIYVNPTTIGRINVIHDFNLNRMSFKMSHDVSLKESS